MELDKMPSQEELEWYLSGNGKDRKGVAVFYDINLGVFQTIPSFRERVAAWKSSLPPKYDDPFRLAEMPSRALIDALVHNQPGVMFSFITHRLEFFL